MTNRPIRILQWGMGDNRGGVESFMFQLYRMMDREQVQFDFLASHDAPKLAYEDEVKAFGANVYRVIYSQRESPTKAKTCLRKFFTAHPEIVGLHMHANFPYAAPMKYAKEAGIGMRILHSHNSAKSGEEHGIVQKTVALLRQFPVRYGIDHYPSAYFACSDKAAEFMFPGKPFTWIRNGIDTNRFAFDEGIRNRVRTELHLHPDQPVLGFCGRLDDQKNPMMLMRIFAEYKKRYPQAHLLVVGHGQMQEEMVSYAKYQGLTDCVSFLGGNRDDVNELYQAMDAFVMPSRFEGLPIVGIEAQCAGLPCVVSAEAVPRSTDVSGLMTFVSIMQSPETWVKAIELSMNGHSRSMNYAMAVRQAGFDMADVAARMQQYYLDNACRS
ncbi:glycosyltransferase [Bifidobacterium sp. SMB2]|uniref:Glycosyltransferase n=1 Tax=Bifidobacterium saimiriisciurei TaxID=2661627 RepID=A0ABX0C8L0_9BIFI|nr:MULTISPECIES: glycosyltransferase [Bifidobacterium]NEG95342.1 glycosyltransferase [Bifidobacterium sp. SMB2]NEH11474.1 glycosyltransferase [Bifidobacterium saimiriisciurei]